MMAEVSLPSPQTTQVILLGASTYPSNEDFPASGAFARAAQEFRQYLLSPRLFGLPPENLLDLFDSDQTASDQDEAISRFLVKTGDTIKDILLYYVGHGSFVGNTSEFYLSIRRTRRDNPRLSSIPVAALADTLKNNARSLRRYLILDCCFAAAASQLFQASSVDGVTQVFTQKVRDAFPRRGTALLCSSSSNTPSLLLADGSSTMFSTALVSTLTNGDSRQPKYMSLRTIADLMADFLRTSFDGKAPPIELHSPDQREGDVAGVPFFPNPAFIQKPEEESSSRQSTRSPNNGLPERGNQAKEHPVETDAVPWHRDRPALVDELGRKSFAAALAQRIWAIHDEEKQEGSFILHIHGSWGSGKSSLLNLLSEQLKYGVKSHQRKEVSPWIVVSFNAWMHQRLGTPWWWLMNGLFQQSAQQLWKINRWKSIKLCIYQFIWRFLKAGWPPYLLALLVLAAICWLVRFDSLFGLLDFGPNQAAVGANKISLKPFADIAQSASAVIALIITVWGLIFGLSRSLLQGSTRAATILMESSKDPTKTITNHFNGLVHRIQYPVAILIDDLDRCQSSYIVELLEGIQTLFISASVTYVIAADKRWLCASYGKAYDSFTQTLEEPGRPLGYLFLEKAFQLSASVPPMSPLIQKQFWLRLVQANPSEYSEKLQKAQNDAKQRLNNKYNEQEILDEVTQVSNEGDAIAEYAIRQVAVERLAIPGVEIHTEHALKSFAPLLEPNPRAMKRFVNTYAIFRAIATLAGVGIGMKELALWTIIVLRWPLLGEYLGDHPEMVKYINRTSLGDAELPKDIPENLNSLFWSESVRYVVRGTEVGASLNENIVRSCAYLHASESSMRWKCN